MCILGLTPLFSIFPKSKFIFEDSFEKFRFFSENSLAFIILTVSLRYRYYAGRAPWFMPRCGRLAPAAAVLVGARWLPHRTACASGVTSRLRYHLTASPQVRVGLCCATPVWSGTPVLALLPQAAKNEGLDASVPRGKRAPQFWVSQAGAVVNARYGRPAPIALITYRCRLSN